MLRLGVAFDQVIFPGARLGPPLLSRHARPGAVEGVFRCLEVARLTLYPVWLTPPAYLRAWMLSEIELYLEASHVDVPHEHAIHSVILLDVVAQQPERGLDRDLATPAEFDLYVAELVAA